jgi:hypothetical protein
MKLPSGYNLELINDSPPLHEPDQHYLSMEISFMVLVLVIVAFFCLFNRPANDHQMVQYLE